MIIIIKQALYANMIVINNRFSCIFFFKLDSMHINVWCLKKYNKDDH